VHDVRARRFVAMHAIDPAPHKRRQAWAGQVEPAVRII